MAMLAITQNPLTAAAASASTYKIISSKSKIEFTVMRGQNIGARGSFSGISGSIKFDKTKPTLGNVTAKIPITSLDSGVAVRDNDLIGPKYFDCQKFPSATFQSKKLKVLKSGKLLLEGNLSLHGFNKPVQIFMNQPPKLVHSKKGGPRFLNASGTSSLDHSDFGLSLLPLHPDGAVRINPKIALKITIVATE